MPVPPGSARRLIIQHEDETSIYEVVKDHLVLGRDPESDIVLAHHKVSRQHAIVHSRDDGFRIEDLDSSNGTLLNGLPVFGSAPLRSGDEIEIGPYRIHVDRVGLAPALAATPPSAVESPRSSDGGGRRHHRPGVATLLISAVLLAATLVGAALLVPRLIDSDPGVIAVNGNSDQHTANGNHRGETGQVPSLPPPMVGDPEEEAARQGFAKSLAEERFVEAVGHLERLGRPGVLDRALTEAMTRAADKARTQALDVKARQGSPSAIAFLRARLEDYPRNSPARSALAELLLELPPGQADLSATDEAPGSNPGPEKPAGEVSKAADAGKAAAGNAAAGPAEATPDPAVGQKLEAAEAALSERSLDDAEKLFTAVTGALGDPKATSRGRLLEWRRRADRGLRAVNHYRAFVQALIATAGADPSTVGKVPHVAGKAGAVLGIDAEGLTLEGDGQTIKLKWRVVPASTLKALVKKVNLDPASLVAAASVLRLSGAADEGLQTLTRAFRKAPDVKAAIDQELADARQMPDVPEGGFTLLENEWLSPRELARKELNRKIELSCQALLADNADDRRRAFDTLLALGTAARGRLHTGLLLAKRTVQEKLTKTKAYVALAEVAARREELDRRRQHALDLIFDEQKYPYPYRPPEASAEAFAAYQESQPEVDARVAAVKEVWKDNRAASIPAPLRESVERLRELNAWIQKAAFGEVPRDAEWLMNLPAADLLNVRNVATSPVDRQRLDDGALVMEKNESSPGVASKGEITQCRITNEYRLMMGRHAVRLYDPLTRASRGHCQDMERLGFFSHTSKVPGKETPMDRVRLEGMSPSGLSENIALAGGPEGAHNGWLHSPGHHRNILGPAWRLMGAGNAGGRWCQNFSHADQKDPETGRDR